MSETTNTEPEICRGEPLNVREARAALEYQAALAAKHGNYSLHSDLMASRDVIDQLVEEIETLKRSGGSLVRMVLSGRESFTAPVRRDEP